MTGSDDDASLTVGGPSDLNFRLLSRPSSPPNSVWQSTTSPNSKNMHSPFTLPPHEEIMRLIDRFFANTGKLFPYVYKSDLLDALSRMTNGGFQNVERSQLCVLHLMMAFATTHGPSEVSIENRMAQGDIHFQRALGLIPSITLAAANLESSTSL
jgi:hypothetical protein